MAFNENTAQRIRHILVGKGVAFVEKKMFGGLCFMVHDKMCCGTHIDKKTGEELLLCRIGEEGYETALERGDCMPMEFTGRPMKGFVFVTEVGCSTPKDLDHWLQRCLDFNPKAKKSKTK